MQTWFECKIQFEKVMENGTNKKVTEAYLVDALSFSEAESRIIEEVTPYISGEYTISDIKKAKFDDVVRSSSDSDDRFWKFKVHYITLNEKSGAEKKTVSNALVEAADIERAMNAYRQHMKGSVCDYKVAAITETAYMDVYAYQAENHNRKRA